MKKFFILLFALTANVGVLLADHPTVTISESFNSSKNTNSTTSPKWMTIQELSNAVGVDTVLDGTSYGGGYRYILKNSTKMYTFNKIRIDFSAPPAYYNFIWINHYDTDEEALNFSQGDIRVFINGSTNYITHTEFKNKGTFISGNTYEFDLNTILGTPNAKCYVNYYQFHFVAENCSIWVTPVESNKTIGEFSVSANKKVCFSPGNVQYQASTGIWRFAEHQWDYVGDATQGMVYVDNVKCDNSLISDTYSGWIDLFGYSTSSTYFGVNTSTNVNDYSGEFVDWGINMGEGWRTLNKTEWNYILNERPNAQDLYFCAIVNGVCGAIILPDDGIAIEYNDIIAPNNCTLERWNILEARGAIFLPAAGYRAGTSIAHIQTNGDYYAATDKMTGSFVDGLEIAYNNRSVLVDDMNFRYDGRSVRLARDVDATSTAINKAYGVTAPAKVIRNGQLFILRGDKTYTVQGQEVR